MHISFFVPLFATFLLRVSCPQIQFCPENQGFSLLRISCKETLFCLHFCAFPSCALSCYIIPFLFALLRILWIFPLLPFTLKSKEKLMPCAYILSCKQIPYIPENATKCNYFTYRPYNLNIPPFPTIHYAHISCLETPPCPDSFNIFQQSIFPFIQEKPS